MKVGDTMIVRRVPVGQTAPKGYTIRATNGSHHGVYSTHAVRVIRKKKKARRGRKGA